MAVCEARMSSTKEQDERGSAVSHESGWSSFARRECCSLCSLTYLQCRPGDWDGGWDGEWVNLGGSPKNQGQKDMCEMLCDYS